MNECQLPIMNIGWTLDLDGISTLQLGLVALIVIVDLVGLCKSYWELENVVLKLSIKCNSKTYLDI